MSFVPFSSLPSSNTYQIQDLECTICSVEFEAGATIFSHDGPGTPHVFHKYCLGSWLTREASCPTCKMEISHVNGQTIAAFREYVARRVLENRVSVQSLRTNLLAAIDRDNMPNVRIYLNNPLPQNIRNEALQFAVQRGKKDALVEVIANGHLQPDTRALGVISTRNMEIVTILLNAEFPLNSRIYMIGQLISNQDTQAIISAVLAKGAIPQNDLGELLVQAARQNNLGALQVLVPFGPVDEANLRNALRIAAENADIPAASPLVEVLFQSPSITEAIKQDTLNASWEVVD